MHIFCNANNINILFFRCQAFTAMEIQIVNVIFLLRTMALCLFVCTFVIHFLHKENIVMLFFLTIKVLNE